ncbi:MAG TPA: O-antigen ligase family protein [Candidatus Limnocylindrales bacterium]|nr:O-antigen ligase family protein [Candidatus Limnocylindrales bacterium]
MNRAQLVPGYAPRAVRWRTVVDLLPAIYPLALVLGVVAIPGGNILLRLGLVVAAVPGLLRLGRMTRTHRRWFAVLGVYIAAVTLSTISSVDASLSLADLARQVFLVAVTAGLGLALSEARARSAFAIGAVVVSMAATASILLLYVGITELAPIKPVQESIAAYAADRFGSFGNAVAFAAVLAAAVAIPYVARRRVVLVLLVVTVAVGVAAAGSRTTVISLLAFIPVTAAFLLFHRQRLVPMWIPYGAVAVIVGWAVLAYSEDLRRAFLSPALNELTTGRTLLWDAAWEKFLERPLFGWGGRSYAIELGAYLPPGAQLYYAEDLVILTVSGGAHNAFLTVLAERGIVGVVSLGVMVAFLLYLGLTIFRSRHRLSGPDRAFGWLAPCIVVLILVRSLGESPGWFGTADSLVDFLAFGVAAMLVAVAASLDPGRERSPEPEQSLSTGT